MILAAADRANRRTGCFLSPSEGERIKVRGLLRSVCARIPLHVDALGKARFATRASVGRRIHLTGSSCFDGLKAPPRVVRVITPSPFPRWGRGNYSLARLRSSAVARWVFSVGLAQARFQFRIEICQREPDAYDVREFHFCPVTVR